MQTFAVSCGKYRSELVHCVKTFIVTALKTKLLSAQKLLHNNSMENTKSVPTYAAEICGFLQIPTERASVSSSTCLLQGLHNAPCQHDLLPISVR